MGSSADVIPAIQPGIMKKGKVLDRGQQLKLTEPIIVEEVHNTLKGIDDLKVPWCDDFNSSFFKKTWDITC